MEYSRLLLQLKQQLASTEDAERKKRYKAAFVAAVVALMIRLLREHGGAAVQAGWRDENDPLWAGVTLADRDALIQELNRDWEAAAEEGLGTRLQGVEEVGDEDTIHRYMALGAYALLFAGMVWYAFWAGRTRSGEAEALYFWEGTLDSVVCVDCEGRIGKVYRASNLPGLPGDRSTICNGNCRCFLRELSPEEAMTAEETF